MTGEIVPKYYYVPESAIDQERRAPGSQKRVASTEGEGNNVFLWGQSMYILARLLSESISNKSY